MKHDPKIEDLLRRESSLSEEVKVNIAEAALASVTETDRGLVIVSAATLHDRLVSLLKAFFEPQTDNREREIDRLFQGYNPLGSFSACIDVAYALGLLTSDLTFKLNLIRRMRNIFAHESGPRNFNDPRIGNRLDALFARVSPGEERIEHVLPEILKQIEDATGSTYSELRLRFGHHLASMLSTLEMIERGCRSEEDVRAAVARLSAAGW